MRLAPRDQARGPERGPPAGPLLPPRGEKETQQGPTALKAKRPHKTTERARSAPDPAAKGGV